VQSCFANHSLGEGWRSCGPAVLLFVLCFTFLLLFFCLLLLVSGEVATSPYITFLFCPAPLAPCTLLFTSVFRLRSSVSCLPSCVSGNDKNTTARPLLFFFKDRPMFIIFLNPFSNIKNGQTPNTLSRQLKACQGCTAATL